MTHTGILYILWRPNAGGDQFLFCWNQIKCLRSTNIMSKGLSIHRQITDNIIHWIQVYNGRVVIRTQCCQGAGGHTLWSNTTCCTGWYHVGRVWPWHTVRAIRSKQQMYTFAQPAQPLTLHRVAIPWQVTNNIYWQGACAYSMLPRWWVAHPVGQHIPYRVVLP